MGFSYLNNIELESALQHYLKEIAGLGIQRESESIPAGQAAGRITSEAAIAVISSPHFNASAMDGIALAARRTFGATETTPVILEEGLDFERVDTGDPIPEGFDAVVMIEDVIEAGEGRIKLMQAAVPWQHVRQIGEDICAGEMIIPSNRRIGAVEIGALLAGGVLQVKVWKKPVVGVIPTGDEIISPTDNPGKGELIEFNSSIFSSMLEAWGVESRVYGIVPDNLRRLTEAVERASNECDMVIVNAGSSAGREDFTSQAIDLLGKIYIHGIAIRPGKPTILGSIGKCPVVGVPGYPVSAIIVMEKVVKPVLELLTGAVFNEPVSATAVLSRSVVSSLKYKEFLRVKLGWVAQKLVATPLNRGAGVITSFLKADGIIEIPLNSEGIDRGSEVRVQLLRDMREIENTLVVTGSHDPLIDIVTDIMMRRAKGQYVSSSHVGSMGGIMAVKRGEAHMAGIHLLDEDTGSYNKSFIDKYFYGEKAAAISCTKRLQGLMVAHGNPKGIKSLGDLTAEGIRYVNRQKGSGTRILLDYLLKKQEVDSAMIYGYDREEFTHMSVAALVASGSADAGMGILSAAKAFGLDFIPVCEEQYDFVTLQKHLEMEVMKSFLDTLRSDEFKRALESLGGYNTQGAGEITLYT
ncbi:MAG: molybdopterin biosynthesis protein [Clostridia bacterium]|nr:molybdopterin biosynthesis protein [Clostridia bacterium]